MSSSTNAGPEVHALSCVNCRQRKVKCAKTHPCPHCVRGGLECVFPSRKKDRAPRRSKNHELLNRLAKLEAIVGQADPALIARTAAPASGPSPSSLPAHRAQQASSGVDGSASVVKVEGLSRHPQKSPCATEPTSRDDPAVKYVSGEFWANLSTEVEGIKAALDQPSESDDDDGHDGGGEEASPASGGGSQGAHSSPSTYITSPAIFGNAHAAGAAKALQHPRPERIKKLRELYFRNVDPLIKILHRPTIEKEFDVFTINPEDNPPSRSTEALYFAMYFAAVTSLQPEDCRQQLGEDRGPLAVQYRQAVELALARADYLNNTSLESLQALTLYDTCLRFHAESRASWALLALVYRLAQANGLHCDGSGSAFTPYEAEMRRRLWSQLVVLDVRAAQDRGSEPMIREDDVNTMAPTNVDDDAFHPGTTVPIPQLAVEGPTDITFSLCTYRCSSLFLYIHNPRSRFAKPSSSSSPNDPQQQQPLPGGVPAPQMAQASEEDIVERIKALEAQFVAPAAAHPGHYPTALAAAVVRLTTLIFWLTIQYPFRVRQPAALAHRPRVSREHMLQAAVAIIELQAFGPAFGGSGLDPRDARARFLWWQDGYVQWHPLAVALAELCVQTEGPLADRAWRTVDRVFPEWRHKVADERRGALWRPIRKLHRRARERRAEAQLRRLRIDAGEDPAGPPRPAPPPPSAPPTAASAPTNTTTTEQHTRKPISPRRAATEAGPTGIPLSMDFGDMAMGTGPIPTTDMTAGGPGTSFHPLPGPSPGPTTSTPADPETTEPPAIIYNNAHHQWTIDFADLGQQGHTAGVAAPDEAMMMMMDPEQQQQQDFDLMDWSAWNDFVNDANIDNNGLYETSPSSEGK